MSLETKGPIFPVVRDRGERTLQFEAGRPHVSRDMAPIASLETVVSRDETGLAGSQNWRDAHNLASRAYLSFASTHFVRDPTQTYRILQSCIHPSEITRKMHYRVCEGSDAWRRNAPSSEVQILHASSVHSHHT